MTFIPELKSLKKFSRKTFLNLLVVVVIFSLGAITGSYFFQGNRLGITASQEQKEIHVEFLLEIYDKIYEYYWDKISEEQLADLYKKAIEAVTGKPQKLSSNKKTPQPAQNPPVLSGGNLGSTLNLQGSTVNDLKALKTSDPQTQTSEREAVKKMLLGVIGDFSSDEDKKKFSVAVASAVLSNLQPAGRSGLFTSKQEQELKNRVANVNPDKDLYADLGLTKGASESAVTSAFNKLEGELKAQDTPEAKKKLEKANYAFDTLKSQDQKQRYDAAGIEPTVFHKYYSPDIVYIRFLKYSPTTYDEFIALVKSFDKKDGPTSMIFDLRQNVGGAIDALPYLLGNFLGKNQYVYDFLAKGEYKPYRTVLDQEPGLKRFTNAAVLIDGGSQSSAELMASVLKKFRYAVAIGNTTKGWGTVESIFPITNQISKNETFSLFLVHHLTIREDGQPIEGKGVEPDIVKEDPEFDTKLAKQFRYPEFANAIKQVLSEPIKN